MKIIETVEEIAEAVKRYNEYMERKNWSGRTIETYNENLEQFFKFIVQERNKTKIKEITQEDVIKYQEYLYQYKDERRGKHYSSRTQGLKLTSIRSFFREMSREGKILLDPAGEIEMPKEERVIGYRALKAEEIKKIMNAADVREAMGYRDRVIMELLYTSGIRVSELIKIKLEDVKLEEGILIIRNGKGKKERVIPLMKIMEKYLREYIEKVRAIMKGERKDEGYLFLNKDGRRIKDGQDIRWMIRKYGKKASVRERIGTHNFRVSCATELMRAGVEIRYIQELLGHKDIKTTEQYMKVEIVGIKREHWAYHPREHWESKQKNVTKQKHRTN